ncbi:porin [uncultured Litoreibacter sp.]|uniref:porin n=1 Tax=uncultured Litoreibacter sp. TaxID=1392394 RepID=UPI00260427A2|nr:porin [uncultured Litoreibacter sp.]
MKKVLFASTALVAFTGAAAADVTLSGRAEMGIFDTNAVGVGAQFFTDIDVTFTMSGETDNGLTFGASVDLDEAGGNNTLVTSPGGVPIAGVAIVNGATGNNADDGGATIFISGGFGTITMGDTDGAMDWALTEAGNVGNPGSIADDETSHAGYLGSYLDGAYDGQILRWDYTVGDFGVAVSIDDDNGVAGLSPGYAIGFKYNLDLSGTTVALGLGYQDVDTLGSTVGVSASATFNNGLSAGIQYSTFSGDVVGTDGDHLGIGVGYTTGAFSIHANYGKFGTDSAALADPSGYGIAAAYDLGGGAVVHFGYGKSDFDTVGVADFSTVSLGLGLSF